MPKRSRTKSSAKRKRGNNTEKLAEVYIKEETNVLSGSSTDSSSSSESSDSDYLRKVKLLRKKDQNAKKYYKKIRKQIDTFQQNIDIKLNYMDMVLQNILKAQSALIPEPVSSSNYLHIASISSLNSSETQLDLKPNNNKIKLHFDTVEKLEEFEHRLNLDENYREKVMCHLLKYSNAIGHRSEEVGRIYHMMDRIMIPELKALYNWSGVTREKRNHSDSPKTSKSCQVTKRSFKSFPNILLLIFDCMSTFNYDNMDMTQVKNYVTDYFKCNRKIDLLKRI